MTQTLQKMRKAAKSEKWSRCNDLYCGFCVNWGNDWHAYCQTESRFFGRHCILLVNW